MLCINVIRLWSTAKPLIKINADDRGSGRQSALPTSLGVFPVHCLTDRRRPSAVPDILPAFSHAPRFGEV
jgi:hypothetical protein